MPALETSSATSKELTQVILPSGLFGTSHPVNNVFRRSNAVFELFFFFCDGAWFFSCTCPFSPEDVFDMEKCTPACLRNAAHRFLRTDGVSSGRRPSLGLRRSVWTPALHPGTRSNGLPSTEHHHGVRDFSHTISRPLTVLFEFSKQSGKLNQYK
jgi:hypothetical protein